MSASVIGARWGSSASSHSRLRARSERRDARRAPGAEPGSVARSDTRCQVRAVIPDPLGTRHGAIANISTAPASLPW